MTRRESSGKRQYYGLVHEFELRVRYVETDRMGVVYYGHYFSWFEAGRAEYLRHIGYGVLDAENERGLVFPAIQATANYHSSVTFDDVVVIASKISWMSPAKAKFEYEVRATDDGRIVTTGHTIHTTLNAARKPRRHDPVLLARMAQCGQPEGE